MLLHTISTSPVMSDALAVAIRHARAGDSVLLIADAVYAAVAGSINAQTISTSDGVEWYAIDEDCDLRGISSAMMLTCVKRIGYAEFVALTLATQKTIAW